MGEITRDNSKCLLVVNGEVLIERLIHQFKEKGIDNPYILDKNNKRISLSDDKGKDILAFIKDGLLNTKQDILKLMKLKLLNA